MSDVTDQVDASPILDKRDAVGLAAVTCGIVWLIVRTVPDGGSLEVFLSYFFAIVFGAFGVVVGRWLSRTNPTRVSFVLLIIVSYVLVSVLVWRGPVGGPLGYANANAALVLQLVALSALVVLDSRGRARRWSVVALSLASLAVIPTASRAAMALFVPLLIVILLALTRTVRHRWWPLALAVTATALGTITNIGLASMSSWPAAATSALSTTRQTLWNDALALWIQHPFIGSGPGSFRSFSEMAADPFTSTAHSSVLQAGAELGFVGVTFFSILILYGFFLAGRGAPPLAAVAVTAWTALIVHSLVDHVLEYPAVMVTAGTVLGWASLKQGRKHGLSGGRGL